MSQLPKMITCLSVAHAVIKEFYPGDRREVFIKVEPKKILTVLERELDLPFSIEDVIQICVLSLYHFGEDCRIFTFAHNLYHALEEIEPAQH